MNNNFSTNEKFRNQKRSPMKSFKDLIKQNSQSKFVAVHLNSDGSCSYLAWGQITNSKGGKDCAPLFGKHYQEFRQAPSCVKKHVPESFDMSNYNAEEKCLGFLFYYGKLIHHQERFNTKAKSNNYGISSYNFRLEQFETFIGMKNLSLNDFLSKEGFTAENVDIYVSELKDFLGLRYGYLEKDNTVIRLKDHNPAESRIRECFENLGCRKYINITTTDEELIKSRLSLGAASDELIEELEHEFDGFESYKLADFSHQSMIEIKQYLEDATKYPEV